MICNMIQSPSASSPANFVDAKQMDPAVPQFILDAIRKAAVKCGYPEDGLQIRVEPCNAQDGFIGQLFRATLKREGSPDKGLICKIPPLCAARREQFDTSLMFEREPWFYERILPEFERYQRGKGVAEGDGFSAYAKSYVAYYESMDQGTVLVMEDLGRRGFRMHEKLLPLDYEHVKLAMVQMGRLHAVSFAMKRDQRDLYESLKVPNAVVAMFRKNEYCRFLVRESLKLALEIPGLTEKERRVLNQLKDNVLKEMEESLDVSDAEPFTAIIHGDCWINNCMFSYDEVESLDEENARVVIRFSIGGGQESLNEYLLQLVSNAEYKKYSKVLNNAKYEEFKNRTADTKPSIKEEQSTDRKTIKREPTLSPSPPRPSSSAKPQPSRSNRDYDQPQRADRRERSPDARGDDHRQHNRRDREDQRRRERRSRSREDRRRDERQRRRKSTSRSNSSSSSNDDDSNSDGSNDRDRRHHHQRHKAASSSTSSYARTSSGTKKKSHKYKQRRDHSRERDRDRGHSSDEDDRHHKKKTKKSKKQRSRSRSRR